jgi:hypothetical protein
MQVESRVFTDRRSRRSTITIGEPAEFQNDALQSGTLATVIVQTSQYELTWNMPLIILEDLSKAEKRDLSALEEPPDGGVMQVEPARALIVYKWILDNINRLVAMDVAPAPIMSRCYQELSNGMAGFSQLLKVADIPFPFPFAQAIRGLFLIFEVLIVVLLPIITGGLLSTAILAFCISTAFGSLHKLSLVLENPFNEGPNQVNIADEHGRFVQNLRVAYWAPRPPEPDSLGDGMGPTNTGECGGAQYYSRSSSKASLDASPTRRDSKSSLDGFTQIPPGVLGRRDSRSGTLEVPTPKRPSFVIKGEADPMPAEHQTGEDMQRIEVLHPVVPSILE